jgi:hypothetical protein
MTPPLTDAEIERCRAWLALGGDLPSPFPARLLATLDERTRERDELAATLANERGEGEPPSEGWTYRENMNQWERDRGDWECIVKRDDRARSWRFEWVNYAEGGDVDEDWPDGAADTARAAMKAADAALAADGGGRG